MLKPALMHQSPNLVDQMALFTAVAEVDSTGPQDLLEFSDREDLEVGACAFPGRYVIVCAHGALFARVVANVQPAARTRPIHAEQPPVDARAVELVLARQRSHPVAGLKLRKAHGALPL